MNLAPQPHVLRLHRDGRRVVRNGVVVPAELPVAVGPVRDALDVVRLQPQCRRVVLNGFLVRAPLLAVDRPGLDVQRLLPRVGRADALARR